MRLDVQFQRLVCGDISIHLTRGEVVLIEALAGGRLVLWDKLIFALWGCDGPEYAHQITQLMVCRIRKKIAAAKLPPLFGTIHGRGYMLTQPVEVIRAGADPIVIPAEFRSDLERLLYSHPDHAAADRVLASFVVG